MNKKLNHLIQIVLNGVTLYCARVTCPLMKLIISSVFSALVWISMVTFFICSDRSLRTENE